MSQYTLIIDTSIFGAGIALFGRASQSLEYIQTSADIADSARELPLMIEAGLRGLRLDRWAIDQVLVSQGPGSFTGIRVGMAYAFGFIAGRKLSGEGSPIISGVSSIACLARKLASETGGNSMVFLPATKTSGYGVLVEGGDLKILSLDCLSPETLRFFSEVSQVSWVTIGEWPMIMDYVKDRGVPAVRSIPGRDAVLLGLQALGEAIKANDGLLWTDFEDGELPRPMYLRKSTVEEKAMSNK